MKILVTGGTGVIGVATIDELLRQQHSVRLLSRNAEADAGRWTDVEAIDGDVSEARVLERSATGCEAIIHIAGIVAEEPPDVTFETINVGGTRNAVEAASRAGVKRFVFISSLGAGTGASEYHASKRAAEEIVRSAGFNWTIVRQANVYGPGDEVISLILRLVRTLPVVPVVGDGKQPFQPIWHEDAGKALAAIVAREDLGGRILEIAGNDVTSMSDLLNRFDQITERSTRRLPVPSALAGIAATIGSLAG
ncbi:MAG: NAD-dependent epimerase/dehydratase family protein, partial [Nitrospiraceae bacterium]